jgi:hypothetical protein
LGFSFLADRRIRIPVFKSSLSVIRRRFGFLPLGRKSRSLSLALRGKLPDLAPQGGIFAANRVHQSQ